MRRKPEWRNELIKYIEAVRSKSFSIGRMDCALFVAGAIEAMVGEDPAKEFRGKYTSFKGGRRLLNKAGYIDHVDYVRATFKQYPLAKATFGDIAVLPEHILGLVNYSEIFVWSRNRLGVIDLLAFSTTEIYRV